MGRSYTSRNSNSKAVHIHHEVTAYIIISFIYYVCIIAPALISHPFTNMHQKTILIIIYFQNRWSHYSIVEPTYVLMGSPGHYQLIIIFLKLSFFSSDILHDICLNKLFVIVIVIVINFATQHADKYLVGGTNTNRF